MDQADSRPTSPEKPLHIMRTTQIHGFGPFFMSNFVLRTSADLAPNVPECPCNLQSHSRLWPHTTLSGSTDTKWTIHHLKLQTSRPQNPNTTSFPHSLTPQLPNSQNPLLGPVTTLTGIATPEIVDYGLDNGTRGVYVCVIYKHTHMHTYTHVYTYIHICIQTYKHINI